MAHAPTPRDVARPLPPSDAADLMPLAEHQGPFLTVMLPAPSRRADAAHRLEAGDDAGIADELVRLLDDHVATGLRAWSERLTDALAGEDGVTATDEVLDALEAGRVATLLVHDDRGRNVVTTRTVGGVPAGVRVADLAIVLALRSGAEVVAVPRYASLDEPVAALLRW